MGNFKGGLGVLYERLTLARAVAKRQYGLVTIAQLDEAGIKANERKRLASVGALVRVLEGVYRLRDIMDGEYHRILAGCLSVDGVAAFKTAGRLHGLDGCGRAKWTAKSAPPMHLILPKRSKPRGGYVLHRMPLAPEECTRKHQLPVTTIKRTLFDLARKLEEEDFAFAFESAWRLGLINPKEWRKDLWKTGGEIPATMRRMLNDTRLRSRPMQSPLEVRVWRGLRKRKIKTPVVQYAFADDFGHPLQPDFCFPSRRLIIEAIGYESHGGDRQKFEADAKRELRLVAAGFTVLRVTSRMLDEDEAGVMDSIRRAFDARTPRRFRRIVHEGFVVADAAPPCL